MTVKMFINFDSVRAVCIEKEWYTRGTNADYEKLHDFIEFIKANGGISYAYEVMDKFRSEAYDILESYRNETVKNAVRGYVDFVVSRDK